MKNFIQGVKNLYNFFWVIWRFRSFDYGFCLVIFSKSLYQLSKGLKDGYKYNEKEITEIDECVEIINRLDSNYYIDCAEELLGRQSQQHLKLQRHIEMLEEQDFDKLINNLKNLRSWWD